MQVYPFASNLSFHQRAETMADQYINAPEKAAMEAPVMEAPVNVAPGGPVATPPAAAGAPGQWSSGIFDCFDDPMSCVITWFACCVSHGWVMNRLDGEPWGKNALIFWLTSPCCLHCFLWGPQRRLKFRTKYGLPEEPASGTHRSTFSSTRPQKVDLKVPSHRNKTSITCSSCSSHVQVIWHAS